MRASNRSAVSLLAFLLLCLGLACAPAGESPTPAGADAAAERLDWFKQAKFGMFIHWGPYSALAGEWDGKRFEVGDNAEWIMHTLESLRPSTASWLTGSIRSISTPRRSRNWLWIPG